MPKYIADGTKQKPDVLPDNAYDRANFPSSQSFCKTPNYVIVNNITDSHIGFFFGSSASFAEKAAAEGPETATLSGSTHYVNFGKPSAGTTLDIHPTAYSASAADENAVTFIYKSGLSTGGR